MTQAERIRPAHPASMLGLWDVIESTIVTTQGCYLRALKLQGIDSEHTPGEVLVQTAQVFYRELATQLPEKTVLQLILDCHSDYTDVFGAYEMMPRPNHQILALQRERRLEFLKGSNLRRNDLVLAVGSSTGFSARREFRHVSASQHQKKVEELSLLQKIVQSALEGAGMSCQEMQEEEILDIFWRKLNPDTRQRPRYRRSEELLPKEQRKKEKHLKVRTIREYLMQSEVGPWSMDHLKIGEAFYQVLTLRDLPPETDFTLAEVFYGLPFDCWVSVCLEIPPQQKYRSSLDRQRRLATADAGRGGNIEDYKRTLKRQEGENLAALLAETGQRLVKLGAQVVIKAANLKELKARARAFLDKTRAKQITFFEETAAHDREFYKTLPGMGAAHDRHLLMTSNNAVDLLPLFQENHGDQDPLMLVKTARGELFSFNPFEKARDNWNATIFGASGSGKSVFVNLLIASAILANRTKGRLMVIDFAGEKKSSYLMIAKLFGGEYIPILSENHALNPFPPPSQAVDSEIEEVKGKVLTFLTILTDMLLSNVGEEKEEQLFRHVIQRGIKETYQRIQDRAPIYSDLHETLQTFVGQREVDQDRLKLALDLLGGFLESPAASIFNRPSTATPKSDFVILDLFGVDSMEANVAQAVTFVATQWVKELAFDPNDPGFKYIILDEVAQLIRRPEMAGLLDELFSTSRKHRTSVWTVTQSYHTYRQSAMANTVKLNSTTQIFLSHASDEQGRQQIATDYQLQRREKVLFDGLRTIKGRYSEALIRTEVSDGRGGKKPITSVLRVELSPLDYQICTSDAADREIQRLHIEANPTVELHRVLEFLAKKREATHGST